MDESCDISRAARVIHGDSVKGSNTYREHIRGLISDNSYLMTIESVNAVVLTAAKSMNDPKVRTWLASVYTFLKETMEKENLA